MNNGTDLDTLSKLNITNNQYNVIPDMDNSKVLFNIHNKLSNCFFSLNPYQLKKNELKNNKKYKNIIEIVFVTYQNNIAAHVNKLNNNLVLPSIIINDEDINKCNEILISYFSDLKLDIKNMSINYIGQVNFLYPDVDIYIKEDHNYCGNNIFLYICKINVPITSYLFHGWISTYSILNANWVINYLEHYMNYIHEKNDTYLNYLNIIRIIFKSLTINFNNNIYKIPENSPLEIEEDTDTHNNTKSESDEDNITENSSDEENNTASGSEEDNTSESEEDTRIENDKSEINPI